jgi:alpha-beta hydrolase superfamily lysophospholipase
MRSRRLVLVFGTLLVGFATLNVLAYRHAWAVTHFTEGGERTPQPNQLSLARKLQVLVTGPTIPKPRNRRTPDAAGLGWDRHLFRAKDGPLLEAWRVRAAPSRGLVLLFHGYTDSKSSLINEARAFHDLGWSTFLVDFRGSGGSEGAETSIGYHESADVEAALEYARSRVGPGPYVLFGGSMGAASVLKAVAEGARPDALILECPFDRLVTAVAHRFTAMGLPTTPLAQMLVFWGGRQGGFDGFRHNPVEYAAAVDVPVLQMHGADDRRVTADEARTVFARLRGPKTFALITGAGHGSFVNVRPGEWNAAVSRFLGSEVHPFARAGLPEPGP